MASPAYLLKAANTAKAVRSRYAKMTDPTNYRLSLFVDQIMLDENIKFELIASEEKELGGFYRVFPFGPVIVVNSSMYKPRQLFTMAHELGHHFLHSNKHSLFFDSKIPNISENNAPNYEQEANAFAAELVVPFETLDAMILNRTSFNAIADHTGASVACLKWRIVSFLQDEFNSTRKIAIELAEDFQKRNHAETVSDSHVFRLLDQKRNAKSLRSFFINQFKKTIDIVSICTNGSPFVMPDNTIKHKDVVWMSANTHIQVDENLRFAKCPQCGNEIFSDDAKFCKICGLYLYNECLNSNYNYRSEDCGKINVSDARNCEYCGAQTYLADKKILKTWNEEIEKEGESSSIPLNAFDDDDFPF